MCRILGFPYRLTLVVSLSNTSIYKDKDKMINIVYLPELLSNVGINTPYSIPFAYYIMKVYNSVPIFVITPGTGNGTGTTGTGTNNEFTTPDGSASVPGTGSIGTRSWGFEDGTDL